MGIGVYFSISTFIIIGIISIIFFSKKRVINVETKTYGKLLIVTMIGLMLEIVTYYWFIAGASLDSILYQFASKLTASYYMIWSSLFVNYLIDICNIKVKFKKAFNIINLICFTLILILPITYSTSAKGVLPAGPSIALTYGMCFLYAFIDLIICLRFRKRIASSKFTPVYSLLVLGGLDIFLGMFFAELFLIGYVYSLIVIIMYFTIENPDIKMLQQVELARDQAERANRAKSDFLSSMSHEIRTPLNAIVGLSEDNLNYKEQVPQEVVENSQDIINASQTLLEIVGNILDINKIEANKMELVESEYRFKEEIENMCKITQTRIGEKNVYFKLTIADDIPYEVIGDKGKVKEIINNLLTNAIKYTEQGSIDLNIKCINDLNKKISTIMVTCKDTGRGIKAEHINKLFHKFERLDVERNTTAEGTGLGLAITKALVEMMGGSINVQSQFGQGSIFIVNIPQKISKLSKPITEQNTNVANTSYVTQEKYTGKKILIVDDNKLNIKVARKALQDFNFEIEECYDGQECLNRVKKGDEYDVILMDIMMPTMSGEIALEKLKENPYFHIPTIALTADAVAGAKEKYLEEGFVDYIAKPFSRDQIKEKLDTIFKDSEKNPIKTDTPRYDPNVDRFKDTPAYVIGGNDKKENKI